MKSVRDRNSCDSTVLGNGLVPSPAKLVHDVASFFSPRVGCCNSNALSDETNVILAKTTERHMTKNSQIPSKSKTRMASTSQKSEIRLLARNADCRTTADHEASVGGETFSSTTKEASCGPCACFLERNSHQELRKFVPCIPVPGEEFLDAHVNEHCETLSSQCKSLLTEVDRLEATLSLVNSVKSHEEISKEIRVVLYGDLGDALSEELPKDTLSEGLYALNLTLMRKLEAEKAKMLGRQKEQQDVVTKLESLVRMVSTFQSRFETRIDHLQNRVSQAISDNNDALDRSERTESGFDDLNSSDVVSECHVADLEADDVGEMEKLPRFPQRAKQVVDPPVAVELRTIVEDLKRVAGQLIARESRLTEDQKDQHKSKPVETAQDVLHIESEKNPGRDQSCQATLDLTQQSDHVQNLEADYQILEEKYHNLVKRHHLCAQEKMLVQSEAEKIQDELRLCQMEKESLLKRNDRILTTLATVQEEKRSLDGTLASLSTELEQVSAARWMLESSNVELRDHSLAQDKAVAELQLKNAELEEANRKLMSQFNDVLETLDSSLEREKDLQNHVSSLRSSMDSRETEFAVVLNEKSLLAEDCEKLKIEVDESNRQHDALQREYQRVISEKGQLERSLVNRKRDIGILEEELAREKLASSYMQQTVARVEAQITRLKLEKEELLSQNAALHSAALETDDRILELEAESERIASDLRIQLENSELQLRLRDEDSSAIEREFKQQTAENRRLKVEMSELRDYCNQVQVDLELSRKEKGVLELGVEDLTGRNRAQEIRIEELEVELEDKVGWIHNTQDQIDTLCTINATLRAEVASLNADLQEARTGLVSLRDVHSERFSSLEQRLLTAEQEKSNLNSHAAAVLSERDLLHSELQQVKRQCEKLEHDFSETQSQLAREKQRNDELEFEASTHLSSLNCAEAERDYLLEITERYSRLLEVSGSCVVESLSRIADKMNEDRRSSWPPRHYHTVFTPAGVMEVPDTPVPEGQDENDSGYMNGTLLSMDTEVGETPSTYQQPTMIDPLKQTVEDLERESSREPKTLQSVKSSMVNKARLMHDSLSNGVNAVDGKVTQMRQRLDESDQLLRKAMVDGERLKELINRLQEEKSAFNKELGTIRETKEHMAATLSKYDSTVGELQKLLLGRDADLSKLQTDYEELAAKYEEMEKGLTTQLDRRTEDLDAVIGDGRQTLAALEMISRLSDTQQCRIEDLNEKIADQEATITSLTKSLTEERQKQEKYDHIKAREEAVISLEHSVDGKIEQLKERERAVGELERKLMQTIREQIVLADQEAILLQRAKDLDEKALAIALDEKRVRELESKCKQLEKLYEELECKWKAKCVETTEITDKYRQLHLEMELKTRLLNEMEEKAQEYDEKIGQLSRIYDDVDSLLSQQKEELRTTKERNDALTQQLLETNKCLSETKHENEDFKARVARLVEEKQRILDQVRDLTEKQNEEHRETVSLRNALTERVAQLSQLQKEEKRYKMIISKLEQDLSGTQSTARELERRLQTKVTGQGSLEEQFNALNSLYADTTEKYRALSEAYDELQILLVRNRDEYRDAKRELERMAYAIVKHLHRDAEIDQLVEDDHKEPEMVPIITRKMVTTVRSYLDELLSASVDSSQTSASFLATPVKSGKKSTALRSTNKSMRQRQEEGDTGGGELEQLRGQIVQRLFEDSARDRIVHEEMARELHSPSPMRTQRRLTQSVERTPQRGA